MYTPTPEDIRTAYQGREFATVERSIIAGQPRAISLVRVIRVEGDTLWYTSDGVWYSTLTRNALADWYLSPGVAGSRLPAPAEETPAPAATPAYDVRPEVIPGAEVRVYGTGRLARRSTPAIILDRDGATVTVQFAGSPNVHPGIHLSRIK